MHRVEQGDRSESVLHSHPRPVPRVKNRLCSRGLERNLFDRCESPPPLCQRLGRYTRKLLGGEDRNGASFVQSERHGESGGEQFSY